MRLSEWQHKTEGLFHIHRTITQTLVSFFPP